MIFTIQFKGTKLLKKIIQLDIIGARNSSGDP